MGGNVGGRDLGFCVATWKSDYGQERGRNIGEAPGGRDLEK